MADEPENLTIRLLQEMRAEMREGFEQVQEQIAEVKSEVIRGRS